MQQHAASVGSRMLKSMKGKEDEPTGPHFATLLVWHGLNDYVQNQVVFTTASYSYWVLAPRGLHLGNHMLYKQDCSIVKVGFVVEMVG